MGNEPVYDKLVSEYKKNLASGQVVVNYNFNAPTGTAITKILATLADAVITSSEAHTKEIKYQGRLNFKVMYLDEENNLHGFDSNIDFFDKLEEASIVAGNRYIVEASLLDIDTVNVTKTGCNFACAVDIKVSSIMSEKINYLKGGGDNLFVNKETLMHKTLDSFVTVPFLVSDEFTITEGDKVHSCDTQIIANKVLSGNGFIIVQGECVANICYTNADGDLFFVNHTAEFKEELEVAGVNSVSFIDTSLTIKSTRCMVSKIDERNTQIRLEVAVDGQVCSWSERQVEVVTDAFSPTNEVGLVTDSFTLHKHIASQFFEERIDSTATLEENAVRVDKIVAVCKNRLTIANVLPVEDGVTVEGLVSSNVVYLSVENEHLNSVVVELPFSITLPVEGVKQGNHVTVNGIVGDVLARGRRGLDIQLTANIKLKVYASQPSTGFVIKEANIGEQLLVSDCGISIYIVQPQQTLWDVVKQLRTTQEIILQQNPNLQLPLNGGERIVYYKQL